MSILDFIILALATLRLSNALADYDQVGPARLLERLRGLARRTNDNLADGLECPACNSVWIGAVLTLAYVAGGHWATLGCLPFALSGIVVLLEDYVRLRET